MQSTGEAKYSGAGMRMLETKKPRALRPEEKEREALFKRKALDRWSRSGLILI
jgi:hypothetical protein